MAIRTESVRLSLDDDFTSKMARVATVTALANKELKNLDGTSVRATKSIGPLGNEIEKVGTSTRQTGNDLDRFTGRFRALADVALVAGPALIPLGASALPLLSAAAVGLGAASGGIVTAVLAFQGLGDALKQLDAYQLEKTPENLAKLDEEFAKLGPKGTEFALFIDSLEPKLRGLQLAARGGLFPGLEEGIDEALERLPQVRRIVRDLAEGLGELAAGAGGALGGERFTKFFDYLETDARPVMEAFARSTGNLIETFANLIVAFGPLTSGFTGGLEGMTAALAEWSRGLDQNDSFQSFLRYIEQSGPQAVEFLGSLVQAFAALAQAAAPYGAVVLPALTALADVFATIAASDIGGPLIAGAAALTLFSRGQQAFNKVTGTDAVASLKGMSGALREVTTAQDRARMSAAELQAVEAKRSGAVAGGLKTIGKGAALYGGLAIAASGAADGIGLTNTASLAMMGLIGGPWGAAVGGGVGLLLDWRDRSHESAEAASEFTATLDQQTGALTENTRALAIKKLEDSGALAAAQDLGISLKLVTDAALGNTAAQEQLNAALASYDGAVTHMGGSKGSFSAGFDADAQSAGEVEKAVGAVASAVGLSAEQFDRQSGAMGGATHSTNDLKAAYDRTTEAAQTLTDQLQELDDFLNSRGTFRSYQASLDALRDSLKDAPHAFSELGEAGRENLGNLDQILADASRHLETITNPRKKAQFLTDVIQTLKDIGKTSPEAAAAVRDVIPALQEVRDANKPTIIAADNAEALKKAAQASEALHDLATARTRPVIDADDQPARNRVRGVKGYMEELVGHPYSVKVNAETAAAEAALARLNRFQFAPKVIAVRVAAHGASSGGGFPEDPGGADGMTVPGKRYPYGDKLTIRVAPGEEIITNRHGEADRFRADRAAGRIPGYADGGTTGGGGIGPNSQLYGLGSPWLSFSELAERISHLTLRQLKSLGDDIDLVSKKNLPGLAKALDAAASEAEKALEKSKKAVDRETASRDRIADQMASLSGSISSRLRSDIFAQPSDPWMAGGGIGSVLAALQGDITRGQQFTDLSGTLGQSLHGSALQALLEQAAQSGDNSLLQQFAGASAADLASFQSLFDLRDQQLSATGQGVAQQIFGEAYAAQTRVLEQANAKHDKEVSELREIKQAIKQADANNTRGQKENASQVADGVTAGVNGAGDRGQRNQVYQVGG